MTDLEEKKFHSEFESSLRVLISEQLNADKMIQLQLHLTANSKYSDAFNFYLKWAVFFFT